MKYIDERRILIMMQVTATDFKMNFGKYLTLVKHEEIRITKNGEDVAVLSAPETKSEKSIWEEMTGLIKDEGLTLADYKMERLSKHL